MTGKTLDQFAEAHDPSYVINTPTTIFSRELTKGAKAFLITSAQNATPVHPECWGSFLTAAKDLQADVFVIPLRYKNPTSQWSGSQQNAEHWDAAVRPYLWNVRQSLHKHLMLLADIKTQPTATSPLTGFDAVSLASSGILGHTKLQLRCIPTPQGRMAKILTTTGACTVENYTDSKAGKIGAFHHSLSAVLVEVDGDRFHLRQLHFSAKTGGCIDGARGKFYTPHGVSAAPNPLALICGDTHVDSIDPQVESATYGIDGIVNVLAPRHVVQHDLLDAYSCNPHHFGNPFNAIAKRKQNMDDVEAEVQRAIDFVKGHQSRGTKTVIVSSNHDDMLRRWIIKNDWRLDPVNAVFYLKTALAMAEGSKLTTRGTEYPDAFLHWLARAKLRNVITVQDESFVLGGVELGMHGDKGPNGARGSIRNLRRVGVKSVIGHSHTPGIDEGCYQVGTSTFLRLEYNHGASAWMNTHCLLQADGKRQLINIIDGRWRA